MFTASGDIYDLIYSFKNYQEESLQIVQAIRSRMPGCKTVLDIGCGTGEHHKYLRDQFSIDGVDISERFIEIARSKNQKGSYFTADMRSFDLNKKYDAIICLFSSIGYLKTYAEIVWTLKCFHKHLNSGGLVLVEPWFTKENWHSTGKVSMLNYDKEEMKICRINYNSRENDFSVLNFNYMVAEKDKGVKYFQERHEMRLTSQAEMIRAFEEANFTVEFEEKGLIGRGLYYGVKK